MKENSLLNQRKACLAMFIISCLLLTVIYYDDTGLYHQDVLSIQDNIYPDSDYLVSSSKCRIPNYDPLSPDAMKFFHKQSYQSCRKMDLLTYVTKNDNIATLYIDNEMAPSYSPSGVSCCYSTVTRKNYSDTQIIISTCQTFEHNITLDTEPVIVKCTETNNKKKQVYENVHIAVTPTIDAKKKMVNFDNTTKPISVLFVGIDSISRLNLIRAMPETYNFLEENDWIPLRGYNKIDDNTFPNVMGILTGLNNTQAYDICNPKKVGKLDACPFLWFNYSQLGFITGYGEDQASINTFNYLKKGFQVSPVDYYFRPYIIASEKLKLIGKDGLDYCSGPETCGERIMNLAKDFAITFKNYPTFGFFWMNTFSHNKISTPSGMDGKVKNFLDEITMAGITESSLIIFLSDHGMRFGDIRQTDTGWLEERLPYIYVSFPKWFQEKFSKEYNNFRNNTNKLTCPYDVHMTLKHILILSGHNISMTPGDACPKCKSLFEEIEFERSCEDAAILEHWCTCTGYKTVTLEKNIQKNVTDFILEEINDILHKYKGDHKCAKYAVNHVVKTRMSEHLPYKNETLLSIKLKTKPDAVFESTISFFGDIRNQNFSLSGDISRIDSYKKHSKCVSDAYLQKYCYCR